MEALGQISKARTSLILSEPFFTSLALKLQIKEDDAIGSAATDGSSVIFSPKFVDRQSRPQLIGLWAHEIMHCAGGHHVRGQGKERDIWNIATDYAINTVLLDMGFVLPDGGLVDKKGIYQDMIPEAIYNQLLDDKAKDPKSVPKPCEWGMVLDAGSQTLGGKTGAAAEIDWNLAVAQATELAKKAGNLPGSLATFVEELLEPQIDWQTLLWPFFTSLNDNNYSWLKPNRAYISEDEYLPSLKDYGCGPIAYVIDTSGSCWDRIDEFTAEADAIAADIEPEKVVLIQIDHEVQRVDVLDKGQRIADIEDFKVEGSGGTRFLPAFKYLEEHHPDVEAVAYLTDLESNDTAECEGVIAAPVLWVSTTKEEAPFGQTIYMQPS